MNKETLVAVTGTGSDINVDLGFIPDFVEIVNLSTLTELKWDGFDAVNTKGIAADATGAKTQAAAGVVQSSIDTDDFRGFKLEAAATVNVDTNVLHVRAGMIDYNTTSGDSYTPSWPK